MLQDLTLIRVLGNRYLDLHTVQLLPQRIFHPLADLGARKGILDSLP